jgi:nucleotide-binding universal stress UspA family protein
VADLGSLLDREVTVLAERLRHWSGSRWRTPAPPYKHRSEAAFDLAKTFAELSGAPVPLPWIADHVVPDQIAVTCHDLASSDPDEQVLERALEELRRTRDLLGVKVAT